jgi:hypothetical protein
MQSRKTSQDFSSTINSSNLRVGCEVPRNIDTDLTLLSTAVLTVLKIFKANGSENLTEY